jgi:hypothetical protein
VEDEPFEFAETEVTLPSGVKVTISGPYTPDNRMSDDVAKQWEELKRTGIGPNDPDF